MADSWNVLRRQNPPSLASETRAASLDIVEVDYSKSDARRQASRCLRCNVNTIFDTSICVACNGCVDICPEDLIRLVGLSHLVRDDHWMGRAIEEFGDLGGYTDRQLDEMGAVMMKDETTCIRCALCASRCPTHAILMKHFEFHSSCVTVPTRNPKVRYA